VVFFGSGAKSIAVTCWMPVGPGSARETGGGCGLEQSSYRAIPTRHRRDGTAPSGPEVARSDLAAYPAAMDWLFLRGLARAAAHWDRQPAALEAALPGDRVHTLDLPGIATAVERRAPWSVAAMVGDLRERWLELRDGTPAAGPLGQARGERTGAGPSGEPGRPWGILGISLGGMVAMQWLASHPTDFERGVVIVSSAANLSPPWRRMLPSCTPTYLAALFARDVEARERRILGVITNDDARRPGLVAKNVALAPTTPIPIPVAVRQLSAATVWRAPRTLPVPTLFLGSDADHMVHPGCTPKLATRFDMPCRMHPWGGHELPHDDPDWVAAQVAAWLAETRAGRAARHDG